MRNPLIMHYNKIIFEEKHNTNMIGTLKNGTPKSNEPLDSFNLCLCNTSVT